MRIQISIRTAFFSLTMAAICMAWYAKNATTRSNELRSLKRIEELASGRVPVSDIGSAGKNWCGTWAGSVVYTEQRSPRPFHWLDLDAFRRVTHITFQHEQNPHLVAELNEFNAIESVSFYNTTMTLSSSESESAVKLASALDAYGTLHPEVDVQNNYSDLTESISPPNHKK